MVRRFNDDEVRQIRKEYKTPREGKYPTYRSIGEKYGVSYGTIAAIINGRGSYFWVDD